MIPAELSPLADHLWQSTFCVAAVWLLTLALRKNQAAVRYWLWLAASVKFLIPFSLLASIGGRLGWRTVPANVQPQWSFVAADIGRPFAASAPALHAVTPQASYPVPTVLFIVWLCGFAVSFLLWFRWRRQMRSARKEAIPLALGLPIPVMSSSGRVEPGVFGVRKPVLLLPEGIMDRLTPAQLEAVLAHEMCHVRRHDNLTAAIHMGVEAAFWFYPPVWWIRARLLEERERACDEAVLQSGRDAEVYAEGILNVCKFYVRSPLACVSGISGSDLKKRIVRIMTERSAKKLGFGRKLLLAALGIAAVSGPIVFGVMNASHVLAQLLEPTSMPLPSFQVASVRPSPPGTQGSHFDRSSERLLISATTKSIIQNAYNAQTGNQILDGPSWINSEEYDINAKIEESVFDRLRKLPQEKQTEQVRFMMQSLLAERFKLKVSYATKQLPVYALVVAKKGPKLKPSTSTTGNSGVHGGNTEAKGTNTTISMLADELSRQSEVGGRTVIDETGLKGKYDWTLHWAPEESAAIFNGTSDGSKGSASTITSDSPWPSLFTAIQEQLGLKLVPRKGPVRVLIIDHIEKPSEN